jgi:multisubunit Na+/H+ antiporter MnhF subunit
MTLFEFSLVTAIFVLSICLFFAIIRFVKGPTLPDRVTAFDLFATNVICIIAIYAILTGEDSLLDVAIVLSLIAFLGAMSFAYYLENKIKKSKRKKSREEEESI